MNRMAFLGGGPWKAFRAPAGRPFILSFNILIKPPKVFFFGVICHESHTQTYIAKNHVLSHRLYSSELVTLPSQQAAPSAALTLKFLACLLFVIQQKFSVWQSLHYFCLCGTAKLLGLLENCSLGIYNLAIECCMVLT